MMHDRPEVWKILKRKIQRVVVLAESFLKDNLPQENNNTFAD